VVYNDLLRQLQEEQGEKAEREEKKSIEKERTVERRRSHPHPQAHPAVEDRFSIDQVLEDEMERISIKTRNNLHK
jgi:hypothetical protein